MPYKLQFVSERAITRSVNKAIREAIILNVCPEMEDAAILDTGGLTPKQKIWFYEQCVIMAKIGNNQAVITWFQDAVRANKIRAKRKALTNQSN